MGEGQGGLAPGSHSEGGRKGLDAEDALRVDPTGLAVDQKWGVRKRETPRMVPEFLGRAMKGMVFVIY